MIRPRRNRRSPAIRALVQETQLHASDFILPMFLHEDAEDVAIEAMPGVTRWSIDSLVREAGEAHALGIPAVVLFPKIEDSLKTSDASDTIRVFDIGNRAEGLEDAPVALQGPGNPDRIGNPGHEQRAGADVPG